MCNNKAEKAKKLFKQGYNCAQAVLGAFSDELGIDFDSLMKLSSSFGGGMGRLREVCGAVSAMFMIAGLKKGYSIPDTDKIKAGHYELIQELAKKFKDENKSIICRELLELQENEPVSSTPTKRTEEFYHSRPCLELVASAAKIAEENLL